MLVVAGLGAGPEPGKWRTLESRLAGFELRVPPGWRATLRGDLSIVVSRHGTRILVHDYGELHPVRPFPPRPTRLRLPPVASYEGHGEASRLDFSESGHNFQIYVTLGRAADRTQVLRILATLRPTRPPLANDHETLVLGRSTQGRPIRAFHFGDFASRRTILVVGCIHGTECAGMAITRRLVQVPPTRANVWVIQLLDPDGLADGTRLNGRGVDLNRNFPSGWRPIGRRGDPQHSGPRPLSEPETRIVTRLVERIRPRVTIWYHQPARLVRAWDGSIPAARRYATLAGLPFRRLPWLAGTAPNWQSHRFPGTASFVVELPPGELGASAAERHARAVLRVAAGR